ncbi:MAG TPA: SUMF1/EgtB/PvdO family nonheme iron enzyme [Polyangiaceae bacterium]|nr:SUMF1/EgtB/PvdO family nonheme iron enzyme [Polyangiaceae bacterium]
MCLAIANGCSGVEPGTATCQDNSRIVCGPDLVSSVVELCANSACVNGACQGGCVPRARRCAGNEVLVCDENGAWLAAVPCDAATPLCSGDGVCGAPPSCEGPSSQCGIDGTSCCTAPLIPGGTYFRANDPTYPATVSDFRMDAYEVTVARFRRFVENLAAGLLPEGDGRNPNDPNSIGWDIKANIRLLSGAFGCHEKYQTWTLTPGANELKPMTCIDWFEANAFCTWDGGRLPTEAEWNYAAAGGNEQRTFPWGEDTVGPSSNHAIYGCYFEGDGLPCEGLQNLAPVGLRSAGESRWGQYDLAGNVWEWMQDAYVVPFAQIECLDCANLTEQDSRVVRGGSFLAGAEFLSNAVRNENSARRFSVGVRCVRAP